MALSKWTIDPSHSSVDFSVKHMMISKVKGTFKNFDADITADPQDLTTAEIDFKIDLSSIDTKNEDRDNHLKTGDFFDIENHPHMTFKSTEITKQTDDEYNLTGDLTLRGVTKTVTFTASFEGEGKDPWGNHKAGFTAHGKINRKDFGLTYNSKLETGGVLIGDEVKVNLEIQAAKA